MLKILIPRKRLMELSLDNDLKELVDDFLHGGREVNEEIEDVFRSLKTTARQLT